MDSSAAAWMLRFGRPIFTEACWCRELKVGLWYYCEAGSFGKLSGRECPTNFLEGGAKSLQGLARSCCTMSSNVPAQIASLATSLYLWYGVIRKTKSRC